jgi:hypothetical protein
MAHGEASRGSRSIAYLSYMGIYPVHMSDCFGTAMIVLCLGVQDAPVTPRLLAFKHGSIELLQCFFSGSKAATALSSFPV